ncbi:uncharacterized protein GLRG_05530 [Colletotrichum graminicola M1.001]|uniref:Uncharacterized protein n=1 Tax=Colletotrichum graminicola (strain M1.001 / M2 / FGSC 10212) TaxID=645133 RepID=E3QHP8_COLGM|nr:uncharacterized protein GLRG_05530 [Colletotrichum graminicola M1.001]EFQ30386.1 hypothetical protein GLRG_05530 [Colletotrichum graminicola M1.001]
MPTTGMTITAVTRAIVPWFDGIHLASSLAVQQTPLDLVFLISRRLTVASYDSSHAEEPEYLPYPATKLIVAQYWHCSQDPPFWGYLIVGTFYDRHNNVVWSTEIFAFQPDTRHSRDAHLDASSELGVASAEPTIDRDLADRFAHSLNLGQSNSSITSAAYGLSRPSHYLDATQLWDPSLIGPAPGHWVTQYDHRIGNWVNTWQPDRPSYP